MKEPNQKQDSLERVLSQSLAPETLSDADIESLLADAVQAAAPLTDQGVARILKTTKEAAKTNPAHSDQSVQADTSVQGGNSMEITMRIARSPEIPRSPRGVHGGSVAALLLSAVCLVFVLVVTSRPTDRSDHSRGDGAAITGEPDRTQTKLLPLAQARKPNQEQATTPETAKVGDVIATAQRERRRVSLPDGSLLYVNENTNAKVASLRTVEVNRGEVFVEVHSASSDSDVTAVGDSAAFRVITPTRTLTAVGTKFSVAADEQATELLVTQGKVTVSDTRDAVAAGQFVRFEPGGVKRVAAPRASEALSWTRELMSAATIVPSSKYCGGALVSVDPNGQETRLSLRKYHVDVHIEDGFARTTIDQTYFNHTWQRLEGTFRFPLPPDASLSRLAMYVNGKLMEGGMAERQHARNTFERIRHTKRDPALLEWVDGSTFKMRVFPLEARREKRIVISYSQRLTSAYGKTHYRFPAGHSLDTVRDWSTKIRIKGGADLQWKSSSHPLNADRSATVDGRDGDLVLTGGRNHALLDRDLILEVEDTWASRSDRAGGDGLAVNDRVRLTRTTHEDYQYLMLRYRPNLVGDLQKPKRNWVVLFESSGDRDPVLARTQVEVVRTLLKNAEHVDTFSIVTAGTRPRMFSEKPQTCTAKNIDAAVKFMEDAHLVGALDFAKALEACEPLYGSDGVPYLVHVGSALPVLGVLEEQKLVERIPQNVRYVGVGIGKRWSRQFMKSAAGRTGGYFTQINPDEKVAWRSFEVLSVLNAPRLLNVGVIDPDEKLRFLNYTESIAQGEEICAITRLKKDARLPAELIVTADRGGNVWKQTVQVSNVADRADYLPRSWARLEIDRLVAEDQAKHKNDIIKLSKAMYVMSPFTSLLVLENEQMYTQFKIDRGRKDHWALYACPDKIKVVYEPGHRQIITWDSTVQPSRVYQRPSPVVYYGYSRPVVQLPPQLRTWSIVPAARWDDTIKLNVDVGKKADFDFLRESTGRNVSGQFFDPYYRYRSFRGGAAARSNYLFGTQDVGFLVQGGGLPHFEAPFYQPIDGLPVLARDQLVRPTPGDQVFLSDGPLLGQILSERIRFIDPDSVPVTGPLFSPQQIRRGMGLQGDVILQPLDDLGAVVIKGAQSDIEATARILDELGRLEGRPVPTVGRLTETSRLRGDQQQAREIAQIMDRIQVNAQPGRNHGVFLLQRQESIPELALIPQITISGRRVMAGQPSVDYRDITRQIEAAARLKQTYAGRSGFAHAWSLHGTTPTVVTLPKFGAFRQPVFTGDRRVFGDLMAHAPGLKTTAADRFAAGQTDAPAHGDVDPKARRLIERARSRGWERITLPGRDSVRIFYDGRGRHAWTRTVSEGLAEQVICDGTNLWHLYDEIGLATKRDYSRFHAADLRSIVPWLVPSVDELSVGADVILVGEQTVAIVPKRGSGSAESARDRRNDETDQPPQNVVHLIFGRRGRLKERNLVRGGRVVARVVFSKDGHVTAFDSDAKELGRIDLKRTVAAAPALVPETDGLVVLPMPYRPSANVFVAIDKSPKEFVVQTAKVDDTSFADWSEDDALALLMSDMVEGNASRFLKILRTRFTEKNDRRRGFLVLRAHFAAAAANNADMWTDPRGRQATSSTMLATAGGGPLEQFCYQYGIWVGSVKPKDDVEFRIDGPADGFLQRLARIRNTFYHWHKGRGVKKLRKAQVAAELDRSLAFIRTLRSDSNAWLLLSAIQPQLAHSEFNGRLADVMKKYEESPRLAWLVRHERARALFAAKRPDDGCQAYADLLSATLRHGPVPVIDADLRKKFLKHRGTDAWNSLFEKSADALLEKDRLQSAMLLSLQLKERGDTSLAEAIFEKTLKKLSGKAPGASLLAIETLRQAKRHDAAEGLLESLFNSESLTLTPQLWQYGATLADERGDHRVALERLQKAIDLRFETRPDVIDLQKLRTDYAALLARLEKVLDAAKTLGQTPPEDLRRHVIRAADQWRSLDDDDTAACQTAARLLMKLGDRDLAWDYLTTPLAGAPGSSGAWVALAKNLAGQKKIDLSDLAWTRAFTYEQTNPQILYDHAMMLRAHGRSEAGNRLLKRIADGKWQPRFSGVKQRAKQQVR